MKVICNRGALLESLTVTGNAVNPRSPKPALHCVKLTAAGTALTISATDLEVAIRYTDTQVQIEQEGEVLIPADRFLAIVRESIDDTLSIEISGDHAVIKGQDSNFKIFTQKAADFPPIDLAFGFRLTGVGGVVGYQRTVAVEPLRAGLKRPRSICRRVVAPSQTMRH